MGRELRRVPLDFDWELNVPWHGFLCPYTNYEITCPSCKGVGLNKKSTALYNSWYDWRNQLTQDEVDVLSETPYFMQKTHNWGGREIGWVLKNPPVYLSAAEVNTWGDRELGSITVRFTCTTIRAKRLGFYGECEKCDSFGKFVTKPEIKKLATEWHPEELPVGEGWQVWETVTEGSPVTPVFATAEELIDYLVDNNMASRISATAFVKETGYVPGSVFVPGVGFLHGMESAAYLSEIKNERNNSEIASGT